MLAADVRLEILQLKSALDAASIRAHPGSDGNAVCASKKARTMLARFDTADHDVHKCLQHWDGENGFSREDKDQIRVALHAMSTALETYESECDIAAEPGRVVSHDDFPNVRGHDRFDRTPSRGTGGAGSIGATMAQLFPEAPRSADGFKSLGEYLTTMHSGLNDPRIMAAAGSAGEGIGEDGGFLVPQEFAFDLMDASLENEIVRPRARVVPMKHSTKKVAGFNTQNHTDGSVGGFTAGFIEEGQQMTLQKGLLRTIELKAKKMYILAPASSEILADSDDFERSLQGVLIDAIGQTSDYYYLNGTGAGQPRGVLNDPALITVAKVTGQTADTIVWQNLKDMFNRLHPASVNNAVWVANANTREQLLSLVQPIENVAGTENVGGSWIPAMRQVNDGWSILGIEVLFTEKIPILGDAGDLILVDFSKYIVGMRKEMTLDKSGHLRFDYDETTYRSILRVDGQGSWSEAVTPRNGSTLSWCVNLAARA